MTSQRTLPFLTALFLIFLLAAVSHAALIVQEPAAGEFVVLDEDTNLMWLQDANYGSTELSDARVAEIIAAVPSVNGHTLVPGEFHTDGTGQYTGQMTWYAAWAWTDQLIFGGYDDWRLPSALNSDGSGPDLGYATPDSDMGHLYHVHGIRSETVHPYSYPFIKVKNAEYYSDTLFSPTFSYNFRFMNGYQGLSDNDAFGSFWAVRSVPEPASLLLLGSGLVGLIALKRKSRG